MESGSTSPLVFMNRTGSKRSSEACCGDPAGPRGVLQKRHERPLYGTKHK